jgi:hypothetical protein
MPILSTSAGVGLPTSAQTSIKCYCDPALLELGVRPFSREFLWRHAGLPELELSHATVLQKVLSLPRHDAFVNRPLPLLALQPAAHPLG